MPHHLREIKNSTQDPVTIVGSDTGSKGFHADTWWQSGCRCLAFRSQYVPQIITDTTPNWWCWTVLQTPWTCQFWHSMANPIWAPKCWAVSIGSCRSLLSCLLSEACTPVLCWRSFCRSGSAQLFSLAQRSRYGSCSWVKDLQGHVRLS